jgi:hypothetical protein
MFRGFPTCLIFKPGTEEQPANCSWIYLRRKITRKSKKGKWAGLTRHQKTMLEILEKNIPTVKIL